MKESKSMKLIHDIRVKNFEETKDMSNDEYIKYIKEKASKSTLRFNVLKKTSV